MLFSHHAQKYHWQLALADPISLSVLTVSSGFVSSSHRRPPIPSSRSISSSPYHYGCHSSACPRPPAGSVPLASSPGCLPSHRCICSAGSASASSRLPSCCSSPAHCYRLSLLPETEGTLRGRLEPWDPFTFLLLHIYIYPRWSFSVAHGNFATPLTRYGWEFGRFGALDSRVRKMAVAATAFVSTKSACLRLFPPKRKPLFPHMPPILT